MSAVIRWEEPIAVGSDRRSPWFPVAEELRRNPQVWALIHESGHIGAQYVAGLIRAGQDPFAPRGAFQAKTRTVNAYERSDDRLRPKPVRVYARYVGGTPESGTE